MKKFGKILMIISLASLFFTAIGCQEKQQVNTPENNGSMESSLAAPDYTPARPVSTTQPKVIKTAGKTQPVQGDQPSIKFENLVHDFGVISPGSSITCEFKFKNVGTATLKIPRKPSASCGCTIPSLEKKEYAPGESGVVKVTYRSDKEPIKVMKSITVFSNDPKKPIVTLTVKADIQIPIAIDPNPMELRLDKSNGGAAEITLSSRDGKPFALTSFNSTNLTITADIDRTIKAAKHTIKPKVDVSKLEQALNGEITINVNHPTIKQVKVSYSAKPWVRSSTSRITLLNPIPGKSETREVMVLSNYGRKVEIESIKSAKDCIKVVSQEIIGNTVKLVVEVTPQQRVKNMYGFYDYLTINVKGGDKLTIIASGIYGTQQPYDKSTINTSN